MEVVHRRDNVQRLQQDTDCSKVATISDSHATPEISTQHMPHWQHRQPHQQNPAKRMSASAAVSEPAASSRAISPNQPLQQHSAFMRAWSSRVHSMLLSSKTPLRGSSADSGSCWPQQQNRHHPHTRQAGEGNRIQMLPTGLNSAVVGAALAQWHTCAITAPHLSPAYQTTALTTGTSNPPREQRSNTPRMFERVQQVLADQQRLIDTVMAQHLQMAAMQQSLHRDRQPTLVDNRATVVAGGGAVAPDQSFAACHSIVLLQQQAQHAEELVRKCSVQSSSKHAEPCCVCLEDIAINDLVPLLGCGHRIHKPCLVRWLVQQQQQQKEQQHCQGIICPTCKQLSIDRKALQFHR